MVDSEPYFFLFVKISDHKFFHGPKKIFGEFSAVFMTTFRNIELFTK